MIAAASRRHGCRENQKINDELRRGQGADAATETTSRPGKEGEARAFKDEEYIKGAERRGRFFVCIAVFIFEENDCPALVLGQCESLIFLKTRDAT